MPAPESPWRCWRQTSDHSQPNELARAQFVLIRDDDDIFSPKEPSRFILDWVGLGWSARLLFSGGVVGRRF
ncbi:MAG: hypothetical protein M3429_09040 [Verrucomicrobiota bacterium]|nr:hypothetical protein [Verrucomicrobiota bacterium]